MFDKEKLKNETALVIGAGKSGVDCANLLASRGFSVFLSEEKKISRAKMRKRLDGKVAFETGGHTQRAFGCGFAVKSPGVGNLSSVMKELGGRGIPVFSEIEVAAAFLPPANIFAVTGSNGKTTCVSLLAEMLKQSGRKVHLCGNIGRTLSAAVRRVRAGDCVALEVSSYQLEDSSYFRPGFSCVLNLTADHLERHESFEKYAGAKSKVFSRQEKGDFCAIGFGAKEFFDLKKIRARPSFFSVLRKLGMSAYARGNGMAVKSGGRTLFFPPPAKLRGAHNLENAMAAALMALSAGAGSGSVRKALAEFKPVEHRLETAARIRGVEYVNDSKATNPASALAALKAMCGGKKVHLILGGLDKGAPYSPLLPEIKRKVKRMYLIGEAAEKIARELGGAAGASECGTLRKAMAEIQKNAVEGDTVLFSPACASFDQFKNFERRGRVFKRLVCGLKRKKDC